MKTYIAGTTQEIQNPDISKGYTYPGRIKVGTRDVVMEGSVKTYPPNGLRHREDVYEDCLFYVEGTPPETAQQEKTVDEKISDAVTAAVTIAQGGM
ncbi:hypothetical protein [Subdoligranulum variabile]|uniref:Uncharacterized protein n=1 Tax=Subdoligranulum variabile DSM 15176 TaxID=411471 RepID=D1PNE4_9FIRM|nr:hypothetical protein [Subdoligranulum variabile]EFB76079.1 hypothetical protein SUBVAR_05865 [Subdoligranulum variabile DSM 15176]UWP68728.1 hypothetical protein NQ490_02445 [Subdoligranulum variabile]